MIKNKKVISMIMSLLIFSFVSISAPYPSIAASDKYLILTGDLYNFINEQYVLQIDSVSKLKSLDNKQLGFKIKQTIIKDDKMTTQEEITNILGVRAVTEKVSSLAIFNNIQKMLVPSDDNKTLTFKIGASQTQDAYLNLKSLLSNKYHNKRENVLVEYFDNRTGGDPTTTVKVLYKFGKLNSSSSSNSDFVMPTYDSTSSDNNTTNLANTEISDKNFQTVINTMDSSKILSLLKDHDSVLVKLGENQENIVPKKLLSNLMYDKYSKKEIVFEKYNKNTLLYRWTIPIDNIYKIEKMDIGFSTTNINKIREIVKDMFSNYKVISFNTQENFPAVCKIEIPIDFSGFDISNLKIFSVDLEKNIVEKKNLTFEIQGNMLVITTGFGGNYIITN